MSFPNPFSLKGLSFLAFVFAPLWITCLLRASWKKRVWRAVLFGGLFYGMLVAWFGEYSVIGYLLFVCALTTQPVLFALSVPLVSASSGVRTALGWTGLWVLSEKARALIMHGFSWNLGMSQAFHPFFVQTCAWAGGLGLSAVIFFINSLVTLAWIHPARRWRLMTVALGILSFLSIGGAIRYQKGVVSSRTWPLTVGAVQADISYEEKLDPRYVVQIAKKQARLTEKILEQTAVDFIIWPETSLPADFRFVPEIKAILNDERIKKTSLLIGSVWQDQGKISNSVVWRPLQGPERWIYRKRRLVPFTEVMPGGTWGEKMEKFLGLRVVHFSPGDSPGILTLKTGGGLWRAGILICSEDTVESFFLDYARRSVDSLVVFLNDAWFSQAAGQWLHAQNALIHAVTVGVPVIRVSNNGLTFLADSWGRVRPPVSQWPSLSDRPVGFIFRAVPAASPTLGRRFSDKLWGVAFLFVIIGAGEFRRGRS